MINFSISGGSRKEMNMVHDAFHFALKELMPRKRNLLVDFEITDIPGDADAFHCFIEKGQHEIEVQTGLIEEDFITAIFHEMVHVRQHERGILKDHGVIKSWKGEEYIGIYDSQSKYRNLPWEEEAYCLQEEMYKKWIQTFKNGH
tara:strand:+ start:1431 stop:1865 length:435 start_codon:yes stop_codon:yes gene_type:complete